MTTDARKRQIADLWDAHGVRQRRMVRLLGEERAADCMDVGLITDGLVRVAARDLDRLLEMAERGGQAR